MNISEEIKKQRLKHNWTQEQLAEILNVSRSTISSWEVGRNYPDLETIVAISDLFEVSLDDLLRGDKKMLGQITDDTKVRKSQTKKIYFLLLGVIILLISLSFVGYQSIYSQVISDPNQIESITRSKEGTTVIKLNLPFYRSVGNMSLFDNVEDPNNAVDIAVESNIDWTMAHNESIEIPAIYAQSKQVNMLNKYGEVIKTVTIE